jgi:hypothetical protein
LSIKTLWEADVLPLHHSRSFQTIDVFASVFGIFDHCNSLHWIACFECHFCPKWVQVGTDFAGHVIRATTGEPLEVNF